MKNYSIHMITETPEPPEPEEEETSPTYEEVHNDGDSGYGNMKD